ncbi:putative minor tail protein [Rhodococcus phage Mbo4]|uniref:Minor tail protein n=2 Tax=root TaxID=1 RepID=A0A9E7IMI6_9CAUD|nr:hypothetical protein [Rhodococcus opacus]YP_010755926.1 putative minor tail protein [Rhodococcus phage Mbo4]EKT83032.1 hypothetical protein WSS_A08952 [Rhodococcus opacus M213]URG17511.1 putative minor tail protein [Rhodococcus phage Mbo4]
MEWLREWFDTVGLGAIILLLLGWILSRRKSRAEVGKLDAEAAQIIAAAASALVAPLSESLGRLEQRIEVLESENAHKTKLLDSAIRFIRELLGWIEHHDPGQPPPVIPPDLESEIQT